MEINHHLKGDTFMKKGMLALLTLGALALSLHAYDENDRRQDMQTMEAAMGQIQKGILYNNKSLVVQGVDNLKTTAKNVQISPKGEMDYTPAFAKSQTKSIMVYADKVKADIEAGKKHSAADNYTKVLDQCISCHNKIRKWNQ